MSIFLVYMSPTTVKKSVGMILFDKSGKNVMLIQKRNSYAFMDFVLGRYKNSNRRMLLNKFNNMTVQEKLVIKSLNFDLIWFHLFLNLDKTPMYYRCLSKFTNTFLCNNNKYLKSILNNSAKSVDLIWEPPKGRIGQKESNLSCAIRELKEETGISMNSYNLIIGQKVKKCIIKEGIKYIIYYYVAKCREDVRATYNINNIHQSIEISNAKWVPVRDLPVYSMINDIRQSIVSKYKIINKIRSDLDHDTFIDVLG